MTTIKLKNGSGAPTAGDLVQGEPALDLTNKRLYTEDSGGTVIEVGTNPTSITTGDITATGTATFANLATSGDVTFGDNDKAIFGAGSDLQIYHTGSVSVIEDSGTGNLLIRGTDMRLQNAAGDNNYLKAVDGAEVELMHGGATKLATTSTGIDVTGSVTASDGVFTDGAAGSASVFNEDGTTADFRVESTSNTHMLFVDGGLNSVGIGTASPEHALHVNGGTSNTVAQFQSTDANAYIEFLDSDAGASGVFIGGDGDDFVVLPNATEKFRVTSSGNVGIGTTSPSTSLDIDAGSTSEYFRGAGNSGSARYLVLSASTTTNAGDTHTFNASSSTGHLQFATAGVDRVTIDSSGNVGIGTSSPSSVLHLSTSNDPQITLTDTGFGASADITGSNGNLRLNSQTATIFDMADSEVMRIDSSGRVGIGTESPNYLVDAQSSGDAAIRIRSTGTGASDDSLLRMQIAGTTASNIIAFGDSGSSFAGEIRYTHSNNSLSFDTNGAERMRLDSAGNVGIGTSSPSYVVHASTADNTIAQFQSTDNRAAILISDHDTDTYIGSEAGVTFISNTGGAYTSGQLVIDNVGNVGIGTTSPANKLTVSESSADFAALIQNSLTSGNGLKIQAGDNSGDRILQLDDKDGNEKLRVTAVGNVGIGTTSPSAKLAVAGTTKIGEGVASNTSKLMVNTASGTAAGIQLFQDSVESWIIQNPASSTALTFANSGSERMRIDSSGNLLVGTTDVTPYNNTSGNGIVLGDGLITAAKDGGIAAIFNRMTSDGDVVQFRKDGTTVGSIFSYNGFLGIGSPSGNDAYLLLGSDFVAPATSTGTARDGAIDLGASGRRFKDVYATNGTIQTSDRNEKQDIEELSDAEQRVAVACKGLLRKYRWKSAVEEKGDDARIHFGIIAQDLQDAFTAEGLDAGRYGMFINTTWTDEETGEERSRMGVRYSELLAFIISAI